VRKQKILTEKDQTMAGEKKKYQVIFHVDDFDEKRITLAFNNIVNLMDDMRYEELEVELLVNGPAVQAFRKDNQLVAERVRQLAARGVNVMLCRNAIHLYEIPEEELVEERQIVPAGVSELVRRQAEGWAYIRP
jgi:intracellular sulfur oxidation DsrE/DsrF family protein